MANLKLSEAIRLGAMLLAPAIGTYRDGDKGCAIGAAGAACGERPRQSVDSMRRFEQRLDARFPILCASHGCPVAGCAEPTEDGLFGTIVHLNDDHRWTRESIAAFVETLEAKAELAALPVDPVDAAEVTS